MSKRWVTIAALLAGLLAGMLASPAPVQAGDTDGGGGRTSVPAAGI